jgi:hypothetical protein
VTVNSVGTSVSETTLNAVCALGWCEASVDDLRKERLGAQLKIVGTGFLIRHDTVLTCRHVIAKTLQARQLKGKPDHPLIAVFFVASEKSIDLRFHAWRNYGWLNPPLDDVGAVIIDEPDAAIRDRQPPLEVLSPYTIRTGDAVAVIGYPFGTAALVDQNAEGGPRLYRFGPVIQRGFVSAIAPMGHGARVDRLLLDVRTTSAMSGGAVLALASSRIVGVHTGGFETDPATLAFAAPLNSSIVEVLLRQVDRMLKRKPEDPLQHEVDLPMVYREVAPRSQDK